MPLGLLIAVIALGALILVFFLSTVLKTAFETKAKNERFDAQVKEASETKNAAETEEVKADKPCETAEGNKGAEEVNTAVENKETEEVDTAEEVKEEPQQAAEEPAKAEPVETLNQSAEESVVIGDLAVVANKFSFDIKRVPFTEKLLAQPKETLEYFNELHNELISFRKVNARFSYKCVSYRFGRVLIAKIFIKGKTMKLALALDTAAFDGKKYFQKDMSSVKAYKEVPFTVKIKSARAATRAKTLIAALAENRELKKKPRFQPVDVIKEINTAK